MRKDTLDRGEGVPPLRIAGILPVWLCGIGILPMTQGLEGDPKPMPRKNKGKMPSPPPHGQTNLPVPPGRSR